MHRVTGKAYGSLIRVSACGNLRLIYRAASLATLFDETALPAADR